MSAVTFFFKRVGIFLLMWIPVTLLMRDEVSIWDALISSALIVAYGDLVPRKRVD